MVLRIFLYWLPMVALAFLNAAIRETLLVTYFHQTEANQLSTLTLLLLCSTYLVIIFGRLKLKSYPQTWLAGFLMMIFTMVFEFALGLSLGHPFNKLLSQYDLAGGQLWPLFLLGIFVLPSLIRWSRRN